MEGNPAPSRETVEFARIAAFTDGVFAIAITLLVLSIEVPPDLPDPELHDFLLDSWRQLFAYFLSFAVIGRFWLAHHRLFSVLQSFDQRLLVLTLAYLSMVVLIPFPTELLGDYGDESDAVILYAAVVGTVSLLSWLLLRHMLRRDHVVPGQQASARRQAAGALQPALVFYVSMPVALLSPPIAQLIWLVLLLDPFRALAGRLKRGAQ